MNKKISIAFVLMFGLICSGCTPKKYKVMLIDNHNKRKLINCQKVAGTRGKEIITPQQAKKLKSCIIRKKVKIRGMRYTTPQETETFTRCLKKYNYNIRKKLTGQKRRKIEKCLKKYSIAS